MFDDEDDDHIENFLQEDIDQFEAHFKGKALGFIDSDRLEAVIDYYLMNSQFGKAQKAAEIGDAHFSFNPTFKLRIAQSMSGLGHLTDALEVIKHLETTVLPKLEVYVTRASIYSQLRDSENAIRYLKMALALADEEDRKEIFLDIAIEYQHQRDFESAISTLKKALKVDPSNEAALYEIAFCYDRIHNYKEAIAAYTKYIDDHPYSNVAWYNLGNAYSKIEDYDKSIWAYDYSILINDKFSAVHFNMGNAYLSLGKYHQAIERFEASMAIDGDDAMAFCYLGEAHEQLKEYELAKNYYRLSLELEPELSEAWLGLGIIEDILGNTKEGIILIHKALDFDPTSSSICLVLANAYHKLCDRENANIFFIQSITVSPSDDETLVDYIHFLMEEAASKALNYLDTNHDVLIDNEAYIQMYIHVLIDLKDFKKALMLFSSLTTSNYEQVKELLEWNPSILNYKEFVNLLHNDSE